MPKYKVTKARTYMVEADNKAHALLLVNNDELYEQKLFEGEWTSVKELPKTIWQQAKQQLTGK